MLPARCATLALSLLLFGPGPPSGLAVGLPVGAAVAVAAGAAETDGAPARRVVSLNPSLTQIAVALGAGDALVGVDDFSARQQAEVASLPRVGGLFNPSLEAIVALEPDLVVLVPSVEQRDLRAQLEALHFNVSVFENIGLADVLENIERMGALLGRREAAAARIAAIRELREAVARVTRERASPRTVMVLQRDPIFVVGGGSFLDELLEAAGAENLGRTLADPYPRVSVEWLLAAAPDVLLDLSDDPDAASEFWSRWPALPAVRQGRILALRPDDVSLPGPYLDQSLELLAAALHGERILEDIEAQRRTEAADRPR